MADDVTLPGTGASVATDEVDLGTGAAHVQMMKLVDGTDGGTQRVAATARGLAVEPRPNVVRYQTTPVISTGAYAATDNIGGETTFTDAARAAGGTGLLTGLVLADLTQNRANLDLVLCDSALASTPVDNAAFDPSDADLSKIVAVVPIYAGDYSLLTDNSVAAKVGLAVPYRCAATSLFGYLVIRDAKTYVSTADLILSVFVTLD